MRYRFRLHRKDLPGKPDIILPKYKKVIFIHGCFWHGHKNCTRSKRPTTNNEFWQKKLDRNMQHDKEIVHNLKGLGWDILIVWTCEIKNIDQLKDKILKFLEEI
jgi:DNA mismatch endonuclease (patch repair protein)